MFLCVNEGGKTKKGLVQRMDVRGAVRGRLAAITTTQVIEPSADCQVAYFCLPNLADCAVYDFWACVNDEKIQAVVKPTKQAQNEFKQAVQEKKTAFLAESMSQDMTKFSIGNVRPTDKCTISFSFVTKFKVEDGKVRIRYPRSIVPRYGDDSPFGSHGPTYPIDFEFELTGTHGNEDDILNIQCLQHPQELTVKRNRVEGGAVARLSLNVDAEGLEDDLILLVSCESDSQDVQVVYETFGDDSHALFVDMADVSSCIQSFDEDIEWTDPLLFPRNQERAYEFIFVVDTSGSMAGRALTNTKVCLQLFLRSLPVNCAFNLIEFCNSFTKLFPSSNAYGESTMKEASSWIEQLGASGGTALLRVLEDVFADDEKTAFEGDNRQKIVIVLTDGAVSNPSDCIQVVEKHRQKKRGTQVWAFGLGNYSQELVDGLARAGGTRSVGVSSSNEISSQVLRNLAKMLKNEGVYDVRAAVFDEDGNDLQFDAYHCVDSMMEIETFLVHRALELPTRMRLKIGCESGSKRLVKWIDISLGERMAEGMDVDDEEGLTSVCQVFGKELMVHRLAARTRIVELEHHHPANFTEELEDLGLRFNLMSKATSFIAVNEKQEEIVGGHHLTHQRYSVDGCSPAIGLIGSYSPLSPSYMMASCPIYSPTSPSYGMGRMGRTSPSAVSPFHSHDPMTEINGDKRIANRWDAYHKRALDRDVMTPARHDAFATPAVQGQKPKATNRSYRDVMQERALEQEKRDFQREIDRDERERAKQKRDPKSKVKPSKMELDDDSATPHVPSKNSKRRWDQDDAATPSAKRSRWDATPASGKDTISTPAAQQWEATPRVAGVVTPGLGWGTTPGASGATPGAMTPSAMTPGAMTPGVITPGAIASTPSAMHGATPIGSRTPGLGWSSTPSRGGRRWDATPGVTPFGVTPGMTPSKPTRWDATPDQRGATPSATPSRFGGATPAGGTPSQTPTYLSTPATPTTPEQYQNLRIQAEIDMRNAPLADEDIDEMLKEVKGYAIVPTPANYVQRPTPLRPRLAPTPFTQSPSGFHMQATPGPHQALEGIPIPSDPDLPSVKPEDRDYFRDLMERNDDEVTDPEEIKKRMILKLILKVKNGTPPQRKNALRHLSDKAREFGAKALFDTILPLLMSPTLEDQERHLLVKVIDRILYKLDDLVRPYVHKILVVIEPLLIDEDYYARVEGREIIANLSKAAGLASMISTMRPDIDNIDEYVRNTTARAFSVVASALGIPVLLPFLRAVCQSKKSWEARHTGVKIIQQIAILMGCAVLPHLRQLVEIIENGLTDEQTKVRTITALALAALAEAASPYGIEAFDTVLRPLWHGIEQHRGKTRAAFLKAIGYIIPLMDPKYASYYTREVMPHLRSEFGSHDEEMKKIVLKVVKQCVSTQGVAPSYVTTEILPEFFKNFWNRRMAIERRNYKQLVETTVEIAEKVGGAEIIHRVVEDLRDENETYRKMVMETIDKTIEKMGVADIDQRLEEALIDGILFAFQEQTAEESQVMLSGFGTVLNTLGQRTKPYLPQICGVVKFRLNNKSPRVRQQAADLIGRIAPVMKVCNEMKLLKHLGKVLFEFLGEEYPEVLGSIIGGLKAVVNVVGMTDMTPPIKDLLPRLTPIMKNRHEKVQENCIDLVGRIADRGSEFVSPREWMRIAYELLDMLKAHKKGIRRAAVNTFGYIAKAVGPQDVIEILLNNLRVQERQNRVCTTVAIAIVAETCSPFTVLPALMNEYRVPELNVQNGVLKSLSFLFEYIGETGRDYVNPVVSLLEDALMDRDLVHRQTACSVVKHMSLGVYGLGREDALQHLLNFVWPNIFETSPHLVNAFTEAVDGLRISLGPGILLQYMLQGLFHPARKVRNVYWRLYNNLYIGHEDAMVALYPVFERDESSPNNYRREELFYFI